MTLHRGALLAAAAVVLAAAVEWCMDDACPEDEHDEVGLLALSRTVQKDPSAAVGEPEVYPNHQPPPKIKASDPYAPVGNDLVTPTAKTQGDSIRCPHDPSDQITIKCERNVCCKGFVATGGKSFPCPNADVTFDGCEGGHEETIKALVATLCRAHKYTFLRGFGWNLGLPQSGVYAGNAGYQNEYGIPTLNMHDSSNGFHAYVKEQLPHITGWPAILTVASSWDENDFRAWAKALGEEHRSKGANAILGPGVNLHRVALGGRNIEYVSGESPYFGARMVKPWVEGLQSSSVVAVVKHFGQNEQESNRSLVNAIVDDRTRWEMYYPPFQAAVDAGAAAVMCAYNLVNGKHACGNGEIVNTDLKQDMKFEGWVQSDWWALHSFAATDGVDQEMPGAATCKDSVHFTDSHLNTLNLSKIDDMVTRIFTPMMTHGLFEARNRVCFPGPDCRHVLYEVMATNDVHQSLAKQLATKAVILLKNEANVLPLPSGTTKLALIGPACDAPQDELTMLSPFDWNIGSLYNIGGSGRVIAHEVESILDGLEAACQSRSCNVVHYKGTDVSKAVAFASAPDVDVAFICAGATSSEGEDRHTLSLSDEQFMVKVAQALHGKKKLVSLTITPGAATLPWIPDVDGALNLFLAGKYTGSAFASAVFGSHNPSAKLTVTIPLSEDDTVRPCRTIDCPYVEKLNVGYLALQDKPVTFPFGHGHSYTTFAYYHVNTSQGSACGKGVVCIHTKVVNSGRVAGAEVAQLYLTYPDAAGEPSKQLRGFFRTDELAAGGESVFTLALSARDVSIYEVSRRAWQIPSGTFKFDVGSSSRDFRFHGEFTLP